MLQHPVFRSDDAVGCRRLAAPGEDVEDQLVAGRSVRQRFAHGSLYRLQAIGEQHGLGFLMADGTLTVAQASVISGTDSDPRFEQYYALLPEKQPDVILYDDAEVRDMAEFHAWIEQHFTITDRYTVQHGTASLQVLVVG